MEGKYNNVSSHGFHIIIKYHCVVCTCVHVCEYRRVCVGVCTHAGESGGWMDSVCEGISEAVRLNFDFFKPSSSNLHFRFFFHISHLDRLYVNYKVSKHL